MEKKEESEGQGEVEGFLNVVLNFQKSEQIFMRTPWNNYCSRAPHHLNYIHLSFQQLKGFFPTVFYLHLKTLYHFRRRVFKGRPRLQLWRYSTGERWCFVKALTDKLLPSQCSPGSHENSDIVLPGWAEDNS